jgi:hypothetical protein
VRDIRLDRSLGDKRSDKLPGMNSSRSSSSSAAASRKEEEVRVWETEEERTWEGTGPRSVDHPAPEAERVCPAPPPPLRALKCAVPRDAASPDDGRRLLAKSIPCDGGVEDEGCRNTDWVGWFGALKGVVPPPTPNSG